MRPSKRPREEDVHSSAQRQNDSPHDEDDDGKTSKETASASIRDNDAVTFLNGWLARFQELKSDDVDGPSVSYLIQELFVFLNQIESEESIETLDAYAKSLVYCLRLFLGYWAEKVIKNSAKKQSSSEALQKMDNVALYSLQVLAYLCHTYTNRLHEFWVYNDVIFKACVYACMRTIHQPKWAHVSILLWIWIDMKNNGITENNISECENIFDGETDDLIAVATTILHACIRWSKDLRGKPQHKTMKMAGQHILSLLRQSEPKLPFADSKSCAFPQSLAMQLLCILFGEGRAVADRAFISLDHDDDQSLENADDECRCLDDDRTPVLRHCKLHSPSESDFGDCVAVLGHLVFELVRNTHCNHRVTEFLGEEPSSCISLALVSYLTSQLPKLREDYVSVLDQAYCFIAEEQNNAELNRCEDVVCRRLIGKSLLNTICTAGGQQNGLSGKLHKLLEQIAKQHPFCVTCSQLLETFVEGFVSDAINHLLPFFAKFLGMLDFLLQSDDWLNHYDFLITITKTCLATLNRYNGSNVNDNANVTMLIRVFENLENTKPSMEELQTAHRLTEDILQEKNSNGVAKHGADTVDNPNVRQVEQSLSKIFTEVENLLELGGCCGKSIRRVRKKFQSPYSDEAVSDTLTRIAENLASIDEQE